MMTINELLYKMNGKSYKVQKRGYPPKVCKAEFELYEGKPVLFMTNFFDDEEASLAFYAEDNQDCTATDALTDEYLTQVLITEQPGDDDAATPV